jgi:ribosome-associated protein
LIFFLPAVILRYKSGNPRLTREIQRIFKLSLTKSTGAEPRPAAGFNTALLTPQARAVLTALDDSKAEEVVIIDLAGKTSIADWMIIANGRSTTQVGALADRVVKALKEAGAPTPAVEGAPANDWVLIDAGDLIVHLFRPEVRQFYNLEKMWGVDRPGEKRQEA